MDKLKLGRLKKHLNIKVNYKNEIITNKDLYKKLINEGANLFFQNTIKYIEKQKGIHFIEEKREYIEYRLGEKRGTFIDIPKIVYDYLIERKLNCPF